MVEAVAVVVEACLGVEVLRGEAVAEEAGASAGPGDELAEGIVGVPRKGAAVGAVDRHVELAVARDREKSAHSSRSLQRAEEATSDFGLQTSSDARAARPPHAVPAQSS